MIVICQINGRLPAQCCGQHADQIYLCEQIAPPGHRCQVGEHTILHERMGNGYTCATVEDQLHNQGGLRGWIGSASTSWTRIGP